MQATKTAAKDTRREMVHILVVDDEKSICELLEITFRKEGHRVEVAHSVEEAKRKLGGSLYDIIMSDVRMPGATGVELLRFTREIAPDSYFVLITGVPTLETAIAAANEGANRYVIKDHDLVEQLRVAVREVSENLKWKKEAGYLRRELRRLTGLDNIIGQSSKMRAIFDMIQTVAPQTSRVLITGESGTGKELVARAIHENSARAQAPFITINCGAFPETLLESELFGYIKGAFTGANENRRGLFQAAHGGTLFMDEIGNMDQTMQVKLYRVLQEGKVRPLGSTEELDVDVRVIAATNKDLEKAIADGEFREDLFYRLSVIPIHVPPLRERREDIPLLARHFLERFRKSMEKPLEAISPQAMQRLESYDWPGNVRELENTLERAVALESGPEISTTVLPDRVSGVGTPTLAAAGQQLENLQIPPEGIDFERVVAETEKRYLQAALEKADGVRTRAAEMLKISYRSFRHFAKKHDL
jgi:two-component system, NtrC family, response regulator PilR